MKITNLGKFCMKSLIYLWLIIFSFVPLLIVLKISFSEPQATTPPYFPAISFLKPYAFSFQVYLKHYSDIIFHDFYFTVLRSSLEIAVLSTIASAIVGYILAFSIVCCERSVRPVLLFFVVLPFFTSFLMRIYAWMGLLSTHGLINKALLFLGIINTPIEFVGNLWAICLGIVYCYLPFMVLPIYAVLDKIDPVYLEAAYDLGAKPFQAFRRVTLPLSYQGLLTGCLLVFIPSVGEFVIPELLGSPSTLTFGRSIFWEFFGNHNWPMTCTMAVVTIALLVIPTVIFQHYQTYKEGKP